MWPPIVIANYNAMKASLDDEYATAKNDAERARIEAKQDLLGVTILMQIRGLGKTGGSLASGGNKTNSHASINNNASHSGGSNTGTSASTSNTNVANSGVGSINDQSSVTSSSSQKGTSQGAAQNSTGASSQSKQNDKWSPGKDNDANINVTTHWNKHRDEFPELSNINEYVNQTHSIVQSPPSAAQIKIRDNGDVLIYNEKTNTLVITTKDGTPRTMFKPDEGTGYFESLKGTAVDRTEYLKRITGQ